MRYLILAIISAITFAEDKPVPLPMEVQQVTAEYEKGIYQVYKIYDTATSKASDVAIVALEKAKKEYMVKGDLEGANLIATAIKNINDGTTLDAVEAKIKSAIALTGHPIEGSWTVSHGYVFALKNGIAAIYRIGERPPNKPAGIYKIDPKDSKSLTINWENGNFDVITMTDNNTARVLFGGTGQGSMTRNKP